jgi:hypothetical protein
MKAAESGEAVQRRALDLVGQRARTCLDVVLRAFALEPDADDLALGAAVGFPRCVRHPDAAASAALTAFLTKSLVSVSSTPAPGDACLFGIKTGRTRGDHVGVLTRRGLVHFAVPPGRVVLAPFDRRFADRLLGVFRAP